ncbi:MAG TPA: RDD family protein [Ramlibacter sp.]
MGTPTVRRRLASLLYEVLVVIALVIVVVTLFSLVAVAVPAVGRQRPLLLALCFASLGGYFIYCWHNGQTLAMRAWKIRIVDPADEPLPLGRACIRYVIAWVWVAPPLALVAAIKPAAQSFSAALGIDFAAVLAWVVLWASAALLRCDRQFWHDAAAGTRLVDA